MDLKEAANIIGLPKTASEEELKSKYKELAKKFHPDIYKEDPDKFKKINEAYQLIQDYKANPHKYDNPGPSFRRSPFEDFNGFGVNFDEIFFNQQQQQHQKTFRYGPLSTEVKLTFIESVLGVDKQIKYKKYIKCIKCNSKGTEPIGNGCKSCNGFGRIVSNNKGMVYTRVCAKCYGKDIKIKPCVPCNSVGVVEVESDLTVHIPPGTINNSTLRLQGAGHYIGPNMFGDAHADVFINVRVSSEDGLILEGPNVVSTIKISLLDALIGCDREVKTILDIRKIAVPPKSKNKDEIHIAGCGVKSVNGIQRVIIDVEYPSDSDDLIKFLKKE